jgi:hypothetical protein
MLSIPPPTVAGEARLARCIVVAKELRELLSCLQDASLRAEVSQQRTK